MIFPLVPPVSAVWPPLGLGPVGCLQPSAWGWRQGSGRSSASPHRRRLEGKFAAPQLGDPSWAAVLFLDPPKHPQSRSEAVQGECLREFLLLEMKFYVGSVLGRGFFPVNLWQLTG